MGPGTTFSLGSGVLPVPVPEPRPGTSLSAEQQELMTQFCTQGPAFEQALLRDLVQQGEIELAALLVHEAVDGEAEDPEGVETDLSDEDVFGERDLEADRLEALFPAEDAFELRVRSTASGPVCDPPDSLCGAFRSLTATGSVFLLAGARRREVYRRIAAWLQTVRGDLLRRGPAELAQPAVQIGQRAFARAQLLDLYARVKDEDQALDDAATLLSQCLKGARLSWGRVSVPLRSVFQ